MTTIDAIDTKFHGLLHDQVRSELGASQQYLAIAVYMDGAVLPQLAKFFYRQSIEERNHHARSPLPQAIPLHRRPQAARSSPVRRR
jgi:hypothetical protein